MDFATLVNTQPAVTVDEFAALAGLPPARKERMDAARFAHETIELLTGPFECSPSTRDLLTLQGIEADGATRYFDDDEKKIVVADVGASYVVDHDVWENADVSAAWRALLEQAGVSQ